MSKTISHADWVSEGKRLFGEDVMKWRFVCPSCSNVASVEDYRGFKGASPDSATCECVGRYTGARGAFDPQTYKPCNYAGYGLFRISPVIILEENGMQIHSFAFAEPPADSAGVESQQSAVEPAGQVEAQ